MKLVAMVALAACGHAPPSPPPPPPSVQVIVDAPVDVVELERQVTIPIETGLASIGRFHSVTQFGRAVITIEYTGDVLAARQQVMAMLESVQLPEGIHPDLGSLTTSDGAIVRYIVRGPGDPRTLQDWTIRPRLLRVPGIADVSTCGTPAQQLQIFVGASQLDAVRTAFARRSDDLVVRSPSFKLAEVPAIVATIPGAELVHATESRTCFAADPTGTDLVVGTVWLRAGADRAEVTAAVDRAFSELRASGMKLDVVGGAFEATVAAAGPLDDLAKAITPPLALVESGRPDGGYLDGLPDELHVHAADRATAQRAAEQLATSLHGTSWTDATTITRIAGPDLDELARLAATVPDALERTTGRVPSIQIKIDRAAAARADLSIATITDELLAEKAGLPITEAWDGDHRIEVVARTKDALPPVATQTTGEVPTVILRDNGQRYVIVRTRGAISKLDVPSGYTAR